MQHALFPTLEGKHEKTAFYVVRHEAIHAHAWHTVTNLGISLLIQIQLKHTSTSFVEDLFHGQTNFAGIN